MSNPEGTFVDVGDGLRMHCNVVGEGPPVLFLHGSGPGASGWSNFAENARALQAAGYQSILADSIGYGRSSQPDDVDYTLPFMSEAAARLMCELGHERYTIVGNSQGGAQAIRIALEHPERVERLILMAPGGLEPRETYMQMRGIRSMLRCVFGPEGITLDGMRRVFEKQLFDPSGLSDDVVRQRYEAAIAQPRRVFETMRVDNQTERLGELTCPVLGLWGTNDIFCPPTGVNLLVQGIDDCRVVVFSHCGHWVMVEHPDRFNRLVIDFLDNG
jgi:4,5:9,10-diseco-3-hydroxy-5,9,17-trioxoandrosta-1(10),2-diene-4-oate hydrolase